MNRKGLHEFVPVRHPDPNVLGCLGGFLVPFGRRKARDDLRAFRKRVAKRRARKGYR